MVTKLEQCCTILMKDVYLTAYLIAVLRKRSGRKRRQERCDEDCITTRVACGVEKRSVTITEHKTRESRSKNYFVHPFRFFIIITSIMRSNRSFNNHRTVPRKLIRPDLQTYMMNAAISLSEHFSTISQLSEHLTTWL